MAFVAFLRGMNVGGHRRLRPSLLAQELGRYGVVNVGAAGTLVVRKRVPRAEFLAQLGKRLPFSAQVMIAGDRELLDLLNHAAFDGKPDKLLTRFVSILLKVPRIVPRLPIYIPEEGEWCVRVLAVKGRFVLGEYRRSMKTIACLGRLDKLLGSPATTRSWSTIQTIVRSLQEQPLNGGRRA